MENSREPRGIEGPLFREMAPWLFAVGLKDLLPSDGIAVAQILLFLIVLICGISGSVFLFLVSFVALFGWRYLDEVRMHALENETDLVRSDASEHLSKAVDVSWVVVLGEALLMAVFLSPTLTLATFLAFWFMAWDVDFQSFKSSGVTAVLPFAKFVWVFGGPSFRWLAGLAILVTILAAGVLFKFPRIQNKFNDVILRVANPEAVFGQRTNGELDPIAGTPDVGSVSNRRESESSSDNDD